MTDDTLKAVTTRLVGLPPDPEGLNERRAERAAIALQAYMNIGATEDDSLLYDLLVDLRHWADHNGKDFDVTVVKSKESYAEETKFLSE